MDLLIDLVDFMVMRAQKRGFESQEQMQKYIGCCTRILRLHPNAAAALRPKEEAPPAPAPAPVEIAPPIDWGNI